MGLARVFLFIFNFIFWCSGGAILGLGIYFFVGDISKMVTVVHIDTSLPLFKYAGGIFIGFGALIFLVGFCGCCGAIRKSQCLLGLYITFLVIVIGGEIAAAVLVILYKQEIYNGMQDRIRKGIKENYGTKEHPSFTTAWDIVQVTMECCGADGSADWIGSNWHKNQNQTLALVPAVPKTCCVLEEPNPADPSPVNNPFCQKMINIPVKTRHVQGCFENIEAWFGKYTWIFIGVGFGVAAIEIIGFILAVCVCRQTKKENDLA